MSDRTLTATITAKDAASPVFRAVATGAETMGHSVESAGKQGASGMEQMRLKGAALGALFRETQGVLTEFARASAESAAVQAQLESAIAATGHAYDEYADAINKALAAATAKSFDDENAQEALSALTQETGNAQTALEQLGLAEDLARGKNIELVSAAELVGRVYNGNVGVLSKYGISVKAGADATEALAELQAKFAGQSQAYADTTAGALDRLRVQFGNIEETIGGAMGSLAPFIAVLPGLSEGFTLAAAAGGHLVEIFRAEREAATAAAAAEEVLAIATEAETAAAVESEVASGGLLAVLGPLGLVAAAAAAAFGIYELVKGHSDEATAAKEADAATQDLVKTLNQLNAAGSPQAGTATAWADALTAALAGVQTKIDETQAKLTKAMVPPQPGEQVGDSFELQRQLDALKAIGAEAGAAQQALSDVFSDTGSGADLARQAVEKLFVAFNQTGDVAALVDGLTDIGAHLGVFDVQANLAAEAVKQLAIATTGAADTYDVLDKATASLVTGFADTAKGAQVLHDLQVIQTQGAEDQRAAMAALWAEVEAGTRSFDFFTSTLHLNASALESQAAALAKTAAGSTELASAQAQLNKAWVDSAQGQQTLADLQVIATQGTEQQIAAAQKFYAELEAGTKTEQQYAASIHAGASAIEAQTAAQERATKATIDSLAAGSRQQQQQETLAAEMEQQAVLRRQYFEEQAFQQDQYQQGLADQVVASEKAAAAQDKLNKTVIEVPDFNRALGDEKAKRAIDALAAANQDYADATQNAISVSDAFAGNLRGSESALERVARGSTSAAVALGAFKEVQDGIIASEGQFTGQLSEYGTQLGYIEDAEKLLNERRAEGIALTQEQEDFLNRAAAAEERLKGGQDDATIALGMQAEAYAENMKQGDQLNQSLDGVSQTTGALTTAIQALIATLLGIPSDVHSAVHIDGAEEAMFALGNISSTLAALDGMTATTSVNNVTTNTTIDVLQKSGRLGGVMGYALGGMVVPAEMGEAGAELVHFRSGGSALVRQHGIYGVPVGAYVDTADATAAKMSGRGGITLNVYHSGDINNQGDLNEFSAALVRTLSSHFAGMGFS